ncbi:unnamed protein product, partial [Mesorhabditis spiculigera]
MDVVPESPLFHPKTRRLQIVVLIMIGFSTMVFSRANIAYSLPCMLNSTAISLMLNNGTEKAALSQQSMSGACASNLAIPGVIDYGGSIIWSQGEQGLLFAGAFIGAVPGVLIATWYISRASCHHTLTVAIFVLALSSVLFPKSVLIVGFPAAFALRLVLGVAESFVHPAVCGLLASWFPINERSTAISLQNTGVILGMLFGPPLAGYLCKSTLGWPWISYAAAFGCIGWLFIWWFLASDSPQTDKRISQEERRYLAENNNSTPVQKKSSVPWKGIWTSAPFWAINLAQFTINIYATFSQIYLPTYYKEVLMLSVTTNGYFVAIPYIINGVVNFAYSFGIDAMKRRGKITPTTAVKVSQFMANLGTGLGMISIIFFANCQNPEYVLVILCVSSIFLAMFSSGMFTSMLSLAPQHTASLAGSTVFFAILGRIACPILITLLRPTGSAAEWNRIILFIGGISIATGFVFAIFGTADVQPWAIEDDEVEDIESPEKDPKTKLIDKKKKKAQKLSMMALSSGPCGYPSELTTSIMSIDRKN